MNQMESYLVFPDDANDGDDQSSRYVGPIIQSPSPWRSPCLLTSPLSRIETSNRESSSAAAHAAGSRCHDDYMVKSELTSPILSRSSQRLPVVLPQTSYYRDSSSSVAIHSSNYNNYQGNSQDVSPVVNHSASYPSTSSSTVPRNNVPNSATPLERPLSSFPQHVISNSNIARPRSSLIHSDIKDLSARYGIPSILPPAPSTAPRPKHTTPPSPPVAPQPTPYSDTSALVANYLKMLSQPVDNAPTSTMPAEPTPVQSTAPSTAPMTSISGPSDTQEISRFVEDMLASPEFQNHQDFLTSPSPFDTPYDDFSTSPMDDSPFADFLNTPVIGLTDTFDDVMGLTSPSMDMLLFPPMEGYPPPSKPVEAVPSVLDNLYTISPGTPALDSLDHTFMDEKSAANSSPAKSTVPLPSRRKSAGATGTRKGVTPDNLIPLDAPTQRRTYTTPSATSRKPVPAGFAKKRSRSMAFGDDDDEPLDELPLDADEKEQIEWKRRQNTLAARKSRKRKLEYTQKLETENEALRKENERLRTTAEMYRQILKTHGVDLPVEP